MRRIVLRPGFRELRRSAKQHPGGIRTLGRARSAALSASIPEGSAGAESGSLRQACSSCVDMRTFYFVCQTTRVRVVFTRCKVCATAGYRRRAQPRCCNACTPACSRVGPAHRCRERDVVRPKHAGASGHVDTCGMIKSPNILILFSPGGRSGLAQVAFIACSLLNFDFPPDQASTISIL